MSEQIKAWETAYLKTLRWLVDRAEAGDCWKGNRTAVRTVGGFGLQLDVDLVQGQLPALVTKTVYLKAVIAELLWFMRGETNTAFLLENSCTIWDEWATKDGDLGPVYGKQWRTWVDKDGDLIDQLALLLEELQSNPTSRRMIVSAWNPGDLPNPKLSPQANVEEGKQALAPCHMLFQVVTEKLGAKARLRLAQEAGVPTSICEALLRANNSDETHAVMDQLKICATGLQLRVDQRSADWFLGVPFNIASYGLLAMLLAEMSGMVATRLVMQFGDYHLYENQVDAAKEQLERYSAYASSGPSAAPRDLSYPKVRFNSTELWASPEVIDIADIEVTGYSNWGRIAAPVAV